MIHFARERLCMIWDEVIELGKLHWQENEEYRHGQGFNPDKVRYLHYEQIEMYYHFGARDTGRLVGSGGVYIFPSMHTQRLIATEDTYYLLPEYRKGRNALKFFDYMERFLESKGVWEVCLTTPLTNDRAARIVEYMGYRQVSKGWSKHLCPNLGQQVEKDQINVRSLTTAPA